MGHLPRLALIAGLLCILDGSIAASAPPESECTPGLAIPASFAELTFRPDTFKPYFVGVSSEEVLLRVVSSDGTHCRLEGANTRTIDLHPFIQPGDADVVAPVPLITVHVDAALDLGPPTTSGHDVAVWTAHVRVIRTGTDSSVLEYDRAISAKLAQLPGITASTPFAQLVSTAARFLDEEHWKGLVGLFPIAVFAEGPYHFTVIDPHGRQSGYLTANDIPHATYVTHGTESMIVVPAPEQGLYVVTVAAAPSSRFTLSMARVDYAKGLGEPLVDELAGDQFQPHSNTIAPFVPRFSSRGSLFSWRRHRATVQARTTCSWRPPRRRDSSGRGARFSRPFTSRRPRG
jgi:hypothetical protein